MLPQVLMASSILIDFMPYKLKPRRIGVGFSSACEMGSRVATEAAVPQSHSRRVNESMIVSKRFDGGHCRPSEGRRQSPAVSLPLLSPEFKAVEHGWRSIGGFR